VLLLVVALAVVVPLGVVILVEECVEFLPLKTVDDEVGGVAALKTAPRRSRIHHGQTRIRTTATKGQIKVITPLWTYHRTSGVRD
jgi:hypothetical protein